MTTEPIPSTSPRILQFRLATLLIAMVWIGLACAALATPTRFWVSVTATITLLSLFTSVLAIIYRAECVRAFAVGFLVFGGAYGAFVLLIDTPNRHGPGQETVLPTTNAIGWLYMQYHAKNTQLWPGGGMGGGMGGMGGSFGGGGMAPAPPPFVGPRYLYQNLYPAAQFIFTMLIGLLGGVIAKLLYVTRPAGRDGRQLVP